MSHAHRKGYVPTDVLSGVDGRRMQTSLADIEGVIVVNYEAETKEALSVASGTPVRVLQTGEEWSYVADERRRKKGFVPTAIVRVGQEKLLDYCRRKNIEVVPATMSSEGSGSESDSRFNSLKKALVSRGELSADNVTTHKIFSKDPKAHIPEMVEYRDWETS